jgi:phosphomannomutase
LSLIKSISGIRGTIGGKPGESLTPLDVVKFAAAYGSWIKKSGGKKIVIGRDARVSGKTVSDLVTATLTSLGLHVIDLGLSTTPTVEFAVPRESADGGIIITASHNPGNWNALKLLNAQGEFISDEEGKNILKLAETSAFEFETADHLGKVSKRKKYIEAHIRAVLNYPLVDREAIRKAGFKIAVDAVNSTGGIAVPLLLKALGVKSIKKINCKPNGKFAHNPEPLPENLKKICKKTLKGKFDLGIVVDPDVDRLVLICEDGIPFGEEYTLVAVADYILSCYKGKKLSTVSNLSSTRALRDVTNKYGHKYFAAPVGEVNVVLKMKSEKAIIGGEGNGGIIVPDFHYGRDALIGIGLFLTHLARSGKSMKELRSGYPEYHISKNKIELSPKVDVDKILAYVKNKYKKEKINSEDGIRIDFEKEREWVHLRKSNTEPIIRIIAEAPDQVRARELAEKIISDIKAVSQA